MNTKHRRSSLFAPFAAGIFAFALTNVQPARADVSVQQEIQMGQQVAAEAPKQYGPALPYNNPISRRVRMIGMQIAALSERKNIPFSYTVLQNDKILNAFSAPGGPVFVTTKLVSTTSNDAELAYVLGHETGHIDRRHVVKQLQKQQQLGIFGAIAGALFGRAGQIGGSLFGSLENLKFSRADENQADAVGVRFMSRLGYDPRAALTMLAKLGNGGGPEFLSDHPATNSRIQTVRQLIQNENLVEVARRAGGPRLSANLDYGSGNSYPGSSSSTNNSYPNNSGNTQSGSIDLGAPLRTNYNPQTNKNVVMAPVQGFASWAGAQVSTSGNAIVFQGNNGTLRLYRNSDVADLNGQRIQLPVRTMTSNGVFYAPMRTLANAAGATATIQGNNVSLQMPGQQSGTLPLP